MNALFSLRSPALALAALFCAAVARAGTPVPENFPSAQGYTGPVVPVIPIAKALILPITAYDPDGNKLSFTATSSNPQFFVRVRTGNPLLRFTLQHTSDGNSTDPSYPAAGQSGDMVCQLFRNLTPQTVGYIAGFAQAGFYNNLTFHRLADLNNEGTVPPNPVQSYIFQGGDPDGNGSGGPNFAYDNELDASLLFVGRGQLAMANSGISSTYHGSNGSQFFFTDGKVTLNADNTINTDGRPRFLDFGYTIFGQMTHGWTMLDSLRGTETWPYTSGTAPTGEPSEGPKSPVTIVTAGVSDLYQPDSTQTLAYTDAVLVLSATAPGTANITVTMSDNETPPHTSAVTFAVEAIADTVNSKPFLSALANQVVAKNKQLNIPFALTDLERDFVSLNQGISNNTNDSNGNPIGYSGLVATRTVGVIGDANYENTDGAKGFTGELDLLLQATQFDMTYRGSIDGSPRSVDSYSPSAIAVGDPAVTLLPTVIQGTAGAALTGLAVAEYQSANTRAQATDLSAVINWGDGTSTTTTSSSTGATTSTADFPADSIIPDPAASLSKFEVLGSHTYAARGIYAVTVTFAGANGLDLQTISTAIISGGPLNAIGRALDIKGKNTGNQVVATFTDSNGPASAASYLATIDWGDGLVTPGAIRANSSGVFTVSGSHSYVDAEPFSILVHVHKLSDTNLADDAVAWSSAKLSGFAGVQHLPPFDQAHLVAELTALPVNPSNANFGTKPTKAIVGNQTYLMYEIIIVNAGNKTSKAGKLQVYLSDDKILNTAPVYNADKTLAERADILLKIGPTHSDAIIPPLAPGAGVQFSFENSALGDFRLRPPSGETASGYNVLANLAYSDPIANNEPIQHAAIVGKVNGFIVTPTAVQTDEAGTPATFTVALDKPPGQDLNGNDVSATVPLTVSDATVGAVISPANASLTFDNTNWAKPQTVTIAGVKPTTVSTTTQSFSVAVGPAVSTGGVLDEMAGPSVNATDLTIANNIAVSPTTITTTDPNGPNPSAPAIGHTATITVTLEKRPTATVTLIVTAAVATSTGLTEGLLSPDANTAPTASVTLTFDPADFTSNTHAETVIVTGQADGTTSGSATYSITFGAATSTDPQFNNIQPAAISATTEHFPAQ